MHARRRRTRRSDSAWRDSTSRRANGDGIARLVLSRRNTVIYVYAFSETSDESDTIRVRFR